ncbi:GNAT family N-acetyltransferase [Microbacterium sp. UFMG61]|uniref:GNAT family N-acetyltransferase n=1 Tax=Microbacterium sp. UFMG61 TaxID=2745935 RepID=UPI002B27BFA0|nr:GNAT family N-acetyltransferase [Microbacterium sp. UFMG61]
MTGDTFTERLRLSHAVASDLDEVFAIQSDPRVWTHYPSLRHTDRAQTVEMIERWERSWGDAGLGSWVARLRDTGEVVGNGGCTLLGGEVWNIGYRIAGDHYGQGLATELARAGVAAARRIAPDRLSRRAQPRLCPGGREARSRTRAPGAGRGQSRPRGDAARVRGSTADADAARRGPEVATDPASVLSADRKKRIVHVDYLRWSTCRRIRWSG